MVLADELDDYEIRGEQLSSAGYGAALPEDATDMRSFVNTRSHRPQVGGPVAQPTTRSGSHPSPVARTSTPPT